VGKESKADSEAAAARVLESWPDNVRVADIAELGALPADQSRRLVNQLLGSLPVGPMGATEAARLGQLIALLAALGVKPDHGTVVALRSRYQRVHRLPKSVVEQLNQLDRMTSTPRATPGVLGDDNFPSPEPSSFDYSNTGMAEAATVDDSMMPRPTTAPKPPTATEPRISGDAGCGDGGDAMPPPPPLTTPVARYFNAELEDHDLTKPLQIGAQYSVAFDIDSVRRALSGDQPVPISDVFFGTDDQNRVLTVQIAAQGFEILGQAQRPLQLPRAGKSLGRARFDVSPQRAGIALLTATLSYQGNFITQMQLSCPVGTPGEFTATVIGRPVNSFVALKPRDLGLIIRPDSNGFRCTAIGSVVEDVHMPVTVKALDIAAAQARAELTAVVLGNYDGSQPFLEGVDIPADVEQQALRRLAEAGRRLYQKLFRPPKGADDLKRIGNWLADRAADPEWQLTIQISADQVPVPWSMLYLGEVGATDKLSWDKFLGVRHIVEQMPFQKMPEDDDPEIDSRPDLTLGLNINPTIDIETKMTLVAEHQQRWAGFASARTNMKVLKRTTCDEIVRALADPSTADKVMYFYCHAKSNDKNPDESAIVMGAQADKTSYATLKDLNLHAPTDVQLAGRPLIVLNACESAELSPLFYDGFVPFFLAKGARGVIGTECRTPVLFAIHWADAFVDRLLDGAQIGQGLLDVRRQLLRENRNPLGLLYTCYCDASTQIVPPVAACAP
jgi:CHAT domain